MSLRSVFLVLALVGAVAPYAFFVPWLREHGLDVARLLRELGANRVSSFFGADVIVSAAVVLALLVARRERLTRWQLGATLAATLSIGVSCGLPLLLAFLEPDRAHAPDTPPPK